MSATWPRRCRCCGRRAGRRAPRSTTARSASPTRSSGCGWRAEADAPAVLARDARPSRCVRAVCAAEAGDRSASGRHFRAAREAGVGRCLRPGRRSSGGGVARAEAAISRAVRVGRRPRRPAHVARTFLSSGHSCWRIRSRIRGSISPTMPPSGNGTESASSSSMPAETLASTAGPATISQGAFRTSPRHSRSRPCSTASCWSRGRGQGADKHGGAAASFNALQQRLGRKNVSAKVQGQYPAFVRLYDILFHGEEDLRALPWCERRERLEAFVGQLDPERFDLSAVIEARNFEHLEEIRGASRDEGIEGHDAEAPRQPLRRRTQGRAVVQVEARSADRRLRA